MYSFKGIVKIAGVGVEFIHLFLAGFHYFGVRVSHVRDVVVGIEIAVAVFVEHILKCCTSHVNRLFVADR